MSCNNCSDKNKKGCKSNGNCHTDGCNMLSVYDWLSDVKTTGLNKKYDIVEVRFKNSRKHFFRNTKNITLQTGDVVVVDASPGYDVGVISITGELARIQVNKKAPNIKPFELKGIRKIADATDIEKWIKGRSLEKDVMHKSRSIAIDLGLKMKISDVEYQADLKKATFYYTAEERVDFRSLIKKLADEFKIRIEMRQLGYRQEAARLGGIGSCGRELCCSTWLTDFRSVSTSAARYQQLSLNPEKLSGQCGRLKCCLNYELETYLDAINSTPKFNSKLKTKKGVANHIKTDVFKKIIWYGYPGETGLFALKPEDSVKISSLNKQGIFPDDLSEFEDKVIVETPVYSNVVGQDSVKRFEKSFKKKQNKRPNKNRSQKNKKQKARNPKNEK